jgi:hypothetical protein
VCEFDITYKVIQYNNQFNNIAANNTPKYDYLQELLPGLDFNKKLKPGNNDVKKLKGLSSFFNVRGSGEAGFEGDIDASSLTGGETSTSEVPNILDPEKWRITDSGEAPIGSGLLQASGTDTTSTLEPFDERISMKILDDLPPLPFSSTTSTPSSNNIIIGPAPDREFYQLQNQRKPSTGMLGGAPQ